MHNRLHGESLEEACNCVLSEQKNRVCIQAREALGKSPTDASGRPALGEGKDPVNMEDANIGLGKRSGSLPGVSGC